MGGYGSSRWTRHNPKATVEESLSFDLANLHKTGWLPKGLLTNRVIADGNLKWFNSRTNDETGNINVRIDTSDPDNPHIRLMYTTSRDGKVIVSTDEYVKLSYTEQHFGGKRAWLHCPQCQQRTRSIHCPPGAIRFLCRTCHDLSYYSTQSAHSHDRGKFAGMFMGYGIEDKKYELYQKLWKTREYRGKPSKARKRIKAQLEALERQRMDYRVMAYHTMDELGWLDS